MNKNAQQNNCVNKIDDWHCKFLEMGGGGLPKMEGVVFEMGGVYPSTNYVLVSLLLTLNIFDACFFGDFEHVNGR